jgi:hypothetical protein
LSIFVLGGAILSATPVTTQIELGNAATPLLNGGYDHVDSYRFPMNLARFQTPSSVSGRRQQEFIVDNAAAVPEPDTFLLLMGGLLVAGGLARRRVARERESLNTNTL